MRRFFLIVPTAFLLAGCTLPIPKQTSAPQPTPVSTNAPSTPSAVEPVMVSETNRTFRSPDGQFSFEYGNVYGLSEVTKLGGGWMQDITDTASSRRITIDAIANGKDSEKDAYTSLVTYLGASYNPASDKKIQLDGSEAIQSGSTVYVFSKDKSAIYSIGVDRVTENLDNFVPNADDLKVLEMVKSTFKFTK